MGFREQGNSWPLTFWEHGNKRKIKLETWNTKIEEILLGNMETQGTLCWEQGNMDPPGRPSLRNI